VDEIRVSVNANAAGEETTAVRSFRPESMGSGVAVEEGKEELARQPAESSKADDGNEGDDWHIEEWVVGGRIEMCAIYQGYILSRQSRRADSSREAGEKKKVEGFFFLDNSLCCGRLPPIGGRITSAGLSLFGE